MLRIEIPRPSKLPRYGAQSVAQPYDRYIPFCSAGVIALAIFSSTSDQQFGHLNGHHLGDRAGRGHSQRQSPRVIPIPLASCSEQRIIVRRVLSGSIPKESPMTERRRKMLRNVFVICEVGSKIDTIIDILRRLKLSPLNEVDTSTRHFYHSYTSLQLIAKADVVCAIIEENSTPGVFLENTFGAPSTCVRIVPP
jgi:hypothetical protein